MAVTGAKVRAAAVVANPQRRPRRGGDPVKEKPSYWRNTHYYRGDYWIPAFAGMTLWNLCPDICPSYLWPSPAKIAEAAVILHKLFRGKTTPVIIYAGWYYLRRGASLKEAESAEILRSLRAMKLIAEDEAPLLIALTGGVSAEIVLAKTRTGPICVKRALPSLKVAGEWHVSPARSEAEKNWIRLAGRFLPSNVPEILGEDPQTFTFAMKYLDPERYRNWKSLLRDGEIDDASGLKVGEMLGTIHSRTAGDACVAAAFANDRDFFDLRLDPYFAAAALKNPDVAPALHNLIARTASTKRALVHGDFSPKNILIGPSGPVILDAECACYGDPAFDPAFLLNHLLLKCVWKPQHARRYLALAGLFWQSYIAAAGALAPLAVEERTAALLPGLLLARIDGKSPVEYLTDPAAKDRVRQFAKRFLDKPERSLPPLLQAWRKEFGF